MKSYKLIFIAILSIGASSCVSLKLSDAPIRCMNFNECVSELEERYRKSGIKSLLLIPLPGIDIDMHSSAMEYTRKQILDLQNSADYTDAICYGSIYEKLLDEDTCSYFIAFEALRKFQGKDNITNNYRYILEYITDLNLNIYADNSCLDVHRPSTERFGVMLDGYFRLVWVNYKCHSDRLFVRSKGWVSNIKVDCQHFVDEVDFSENERILNRICG